MNHLQIFDKIEVSKVNSNIVCEWQKIKFAESKREEYKPLFFCCIGRNKIMKKIIVGINNEELSIVEELSVFGWNFGSLQIYGVK